MKRRMSKVGRKNLFRTIIIAITFIIALEIPYSLIKYQLFGENFEQEAAIGVFEIVITAIGFTFTRRAGQKPELPFLSAYTAPLSPMVTIIPGIWAKLTLSRMIRSISSALLSE